jgi:hypothetical protein
MDEIREIGDLRPAPRVTPVAVLWVMFAVGLGGVTLLAGLPPRSEALAMARVGQPQDGASFAHSARSRAEMARPKMQSTRTH